MADFGDALVCFFDELTPAQAAVAGGKGWTLSRLYRAGYPVPLGFVVLSSAFDGDALRPQAWEQVAAALDKLRGGRAEQSFAVRSSALKEDSAQASFAGEFETVLDVRDTESIRRAVDLVRKSRHADRVGAYSRAQGLSEAHEVAVIVQKLVRAEFSGVIFTADPVTGSRAAVVGNYVRGLGEKLVAGEAAAQAFTLQHPQGSYKGPPELRRFGRKLYQLATQVEREFQAPQDLEWAIADGRLALLQARPITTLRAYNPATGQWNHSLTGDYLWTSASLGEAIPDVMSPCTWSLVQRVAAETVPLSGLSAYPAVGNIGGRFYMNLSLLASLAHTFFVSRERFVAMNEPLIGRIPTSLEIPLIPLSRWGVLKALLPDGLRATWRTLRNRKHLASYLAAAPQRCAALQSRIQAASSATELLALWRVELSPLFSQSCQMLNAVTTPAHLVPDLQRELRALVGEADQSALLSGLDDGASQLASLGPLLGLERLLRGELDRESYCQKYGHRGAHEFEVSYPRAAEDPDFSATIERQLAGLSQATAGVTTLLARQRDAHVAAWARLQQRHPRKAAALRKRLDLMAAGARNREAARSELVRVFFVLRAFVQRAGALTGQGQRCFFLLIDEILALLGGDETPLLQIAARRAAYLRCCQLPSYPTLIRGRFDPLLWSVDPKRRSDVFDGQGGSPPAGQAITGFPGATGVVEGRARVLLRVEDGAQLQAGEILVTSTTNVGWTPLFPRAAAIVTDVGAPLSHAAIVARELGIPAVVGCGNATMRLRTGDHLRVSGGQGTVEVLSS